VLYRARDQFEIIIAGVGGQGNVSCGIIIGKAATCHEDKFVTMTYSYGTEARGTFARTDVLVGNHFIDFYECQRPDVILILHDKAYQKIKNKIGEETVVVINQNEVTQIEKDLGKIFSLPLSDMAIEIGSSQVINTIALAFLVAKTGFLNKTSLVKAVQSEYSDSKIARLNEKALEYGFNLH
jgi:2-oxoglutarate ferredoxin oxidoreductase subunit gamma